jgi:hypothetical protein
MDLLTNFGPAEWTTRSPLGIWWDWKRKSGQIHPVAQCERLIFIFFSSFPHKIFGHSSIYAARLFIFLWHHLAFILPRRASIILSCKIPSRVRNGQMPMHFYQGQFVGP